MDAELDEVPVSSLPDRYGVHRSQVYARMDALKKRDRNLIPTKRGKKSYITRQMLDYLDGMAALVRQGQTTQEAADQVLKQLPTRRADSPVDIRHMDSSAIAVSASNQPFEGTLEFDDLLKMLQELADNIRWLSTSQLAQVMGLGSLPTGDSFERYGFRCTKADKNGFETAWKVEKLTN